MAKRDIRIKYNRLLLGLAWTIVQPLAYLLAFTVIFDYLIQVDVGYPYILFVYPGIIGWGLFNYTFSQSGTALLQSQDLVKRLQIPKALLPLSKGLTGLFDFSIALIILIPIVIAFGRGLGLQLLLLPLGILGLLLLALSLGLLLSAASVYHRDLQYLSPFLVGLSIWLTPVFYPVSIIPDGLGVFLYLNPMTGFLEMIRIGITPTELVVSPFAYLDLLFTFILFLASLFYFKSIEYKATDIL